MKWSKGKRMTNKGAVNKLKYVRRIYPSKNIENVEADVALEMAIKALEQEPCEDAISRQIISDYVGSHIQEINTGYGDLNKHTNGILRMIVDYIESMPPVTPQSKTGHWIAQDIHNCHTNFKCSECGYIHNFMHIFGEPIADYTYCPNCGAKMVESQEGEVQE